MNEKKLPPLIVSLCLSVSLTHTNTQERSMSESNGHTALQGLHGCLPSPLCRGSQPVQSVGGFILTPLLLFHMNEKGCCGKTARLFFYWRRQLQRQKSNSWRLLGIYSRLDSERARKWKGLFTRIHWKGNANRLKWVSWNVSLGKQYAYSLLWERETERKRIIDEAKSCYRGWGWGGGESAAMWATAQK